MNWFLWQYEIKYDKWLHFGNVPESNIQIYLNIFCCKVCSEWGSDTAVIHRLTSRGPVALLFFLIDEKWKASYLITPDICHSKTLKSFRKTNTCLTLEGKCKCISERKWPIGRELLPDWLLPVHQLGRLKAEMSTLPLILCGNQLFDTHCSCCEFSDLYVHQIWCNWGCKRYYETPESCLPYSQWNSSRQKACLSRLMQINISHVGSYFQGNTSSVSAVAL